MKVLDRLNLIDKIGRELQSRMSFPDVTAYLRAFGVDTDKPTSGINSKWVYVKELLAEESAEKVLQIADEIGIPHTYAITPAKQAVESSFWEPLHFRLFLSHLSSFKKTAAALQRALRSFGISTFVAHVDIEPAKEWQDEIEAGLFSMDALAAILMPGFKESNWTDQEIGVAVGRNTLIIPIIKGLDPYGFIGKYQGLTVDGKTVSQVAKGVFGILVSSPKTRARMLSCLLDTTLQSTQTEEVLRKLDHLTNIKNLPIPYLERLREGAATSGVFAEDALLSKLNGLLTSRGLQEVALPKTADYLEEDDIPF